MNLAAREIQTGDCSVALFDSPPPLRHDISPARTFRHVGYELEIRFTPIEHSLILRSMKRVACEQLATYPRRMPLSAIDFQPVCEDCVIEHKFRGGVRYCATICVETLTGTSLAETIAECRELARGGSSASLDSIGHAKQSLIVAEVDAFTREVHVHTIHIHMQTGLVARCMTMFECGE